MHKSVDTAHGSCSGCFGDTSKLMCLSKSAIAKRPHAATILHSPVRPFSPMLHESMQQGSDISDSDPLMPISQTRCNPISASCIFVDLLQSRLEAGLRCSYGTWMARFWQHSLIMVAEGPGDMSLKSRPVGIPDSSQTISADQTEQWWLPVPRTCSGVSQMSSSRRSVGSFESAFNDFTDASGGASAQLSPAG